jgi:C_GCAxxG_C_C family probable redox protein
MSVESEKALECFSNGFNCSQAVFASYCEQNGIEKEIAYKIGCGFGAGMSYCNETCGAVTGAIMLLSLKFGKYKIDDNESKENTYKKVNQYIDDFTEKHGSVKCTELLGYNISKKDELLKAREAGVFKSMCSKFVKDSVEIMEKYL